LNANKLGKVIIPLIVLLTLVYFLGQGRTGLFRAGPEPIHMDYGALKKAVAAGDITDGSFEKYTFRGYETQTGGRKQSVVVDCPPDNPNEQKSLMDLMDAHGTAYKVKTPFISDTISMLIGTFLLPIGVIFFFWMFFLRQAQSGGNQAMSFGRSRAKRLTDNVPKVTFDDVAGVDETRAGRSRRVP